jgi:hypothetical protein
MAVTTPGQVEAAVAKVPLLRMAIVKRHDHKKGFVVLPRRRVVERTFSWFGRNRRLAKDFENLAETLATFVTLASIQLTLRRFSRVSAGPIPFDHRGARRSLGAAKKLSLIARRGSPTTLPARSSERSRLVVVAFISITVKTS